MCVAWSLAANAKDMAEGGVVDKLDERVAARIGEAYDAWDEWSGRNAPDGLSDELLDEIERWKEASVDSLGGIHIRSTADRCGDLLDHLGLRRNSHRLKSGPRPLPTSRSPLPAAPVAGRSAAAAPARRAGQSRWRSHRTLGLRPGRPTCRRSGRGRDASRSPSCRWSRCHGAPAQVDAEGGRLLSAYSTHMPRHTISVLPTFHGR